MRWLGGLVLVACSTDVTNVYEVTDSGTGRDVGVDAYVVEASVDAPTIDSTATVDAWIAPEADAGFMPGCVVGSRVFLCPPTDGGEPNAEQNNVGAINWYNADATVLLGYCTSGHAATESSHGTPASPCTSTSSCDVAPAEGGVALTGTCL